MPNYTITCGAATNKHVFLSSPKIKEYHVYLVKVSFSRNSPIHKSIMHVTKKEADKIMIFCAFYERVYSLAEVYHIEIVSELCELKRPY